MHGFGSYGLGLLIEGLGLGIDGLELRTYH